MNTGTCLRPSCTAIVCPMKDGRIIERRDQVLITVWVSAVFCASTFFSRCPSTNGPFFKLRGISILSWFLSLSKGSAAGLAAADDLGVAGLALARTAFRLAPRGDGVTSTGRLALTTTVRVVDRVHGDTADGRALALPAVAAGLAPVDVGLLGIADLADRCAAADVDVAHLAGRQSQLSLGAFLGHKLNPGARGAAHLGPTAGAELDPVDQRAHGDVAQRQVVADLDVGSGTGLDGHALLEALGRDDVALLAVGIVQERDARSAVGVVLDVSDLGRHAVLVVATEVDDAVGALVTATLVTRRDASLVVAAALLGQRFRQRLLGRRPGDLGEVGNARTATARGCGLVLTNCHMSSVLLRRSGRRRCRCSGPRPRSRLLAW